MANVQNWTYKLYVLLLLGRVNGADKRGTRVFLHLPTVGKSLGVTTKKLKMYIIEGNDMALYSNIKKRHRIWSLDIMLPPRDEDVQ